MSDHKFEKQVRQKLGDLKLAPTPESWERIENEIRERKRRPAPIFWLPLLLLGLGAGGYFLLKPTFTTTPLATQEPGVNALPENTPQSANPAAQSEKSSDRAEMPAPKTVTGPNTLNLSGSNTTILTPNRSRKVGNTVYLNNAKELPQREIAGQEEKYEQPDGPQKQIAGNLENEEQAAITEVPDPAGQPASQEPTQPVAAPQNPLSVQASEKEKTPAGQPAASKDERKKRKLKKWSFGLTAVGGVSAVNEGTFTNFSGGQVEDVAAASYRNYSLQNAVINYNPNPQAPPPPAKLYPGFSFSAGAIVKRELSQRFSISAGINYLQLNTLTKVGYKMNDRQVVNSPLGFNAVETYYLPTDNYVNEYHNKYHFIELPVTLHTRLFKSEKLPVYWNAGVSAMTLLSSTALHYDGASGVYFKDDALLNQVQGAITTGFSVVLFNRSPRPLWVGPTARYNISPVLKKDVSSSKNFMGLGLDVRWYLK